jgi:hypothetical protein
VRPRLRVLKLRSFRVPLGSASEPKGSGLNDECFFQMRTESGGSSVEVINIAEKRLFAPLKTAVNAVQNALDCLLFGIIFYFDLRRSGLTVLERLKACIFTYFGSLALQGQWHTPSKMHNFKTYASGWDSSIRRSP